MSLATLINLSPQARKIHDHMVRAGSISARDAMGDYGITSATLARRICDLEGAGIAILRERKTHPIHKREYTRYSIKPPEAPSAATAPEAAPEPLKVGDKVRILASYGSPKDTGREGYIIGFDEGERWPYDVRLSDKEDLLVSADEIERVQA